MGLIGDILGIGKAAKEVAEVFVPNQSAAQEFEHLEHEAALKQYGHEYRLVQEGWFNQFVNGMNRLPRPVLALGTVGLFVFAMLDPKAFAQRMIGLDTVPHELWWLLGAIVSFYFGARELHHQRKQRKPLRMIAPVKQTVTIDQNAAVTDWQSVN